MMVMMLEILGSEPRHVHFLSCPLAQVPSSNRLPSNCEAMLLLSRILVKQLVGARRVVEMTGQWHLQPDRYRQKPGGFPQHSEEE